MCSNIMRVSLWWYHFTLLPSKQLPKRIISSDWSPEGHRNVGASTVRLAEAMQLSAKQQQT
jgi:hypothetical protein